MHNARHRLAKDQCEGPRSRMLQNRSLGKLHDNFQLQRVEPSCWRGGVSCSNLCDGSAHLAPTSIGSYGIRVAFRPGAGHTSPCDGEERSTAMPTRSADLVASVFYVLFERNRPSGRPTVADVANSRTIRYGNPDRRLWPHCRSRGRECMYPTPSSLATSRRMSEQARTGTQPELVLRRELHSRGLRFRVDFPFPIDGLRRRRADIAFTRWRIAVFVDGCFWHSCREHGSLPKANADWWKAKLDRNVARDRDTDRRLVLAGWRPVRIWEHESPAAAADIVESVLSTTKNASLDAAANPELQTPVNDDFGETH